MIIYKYQIEPSPTQINIEMPEGAKILSCGLDGFGVPCIWALVNPENEMVKKPVYCVGTGWNMSALDNCKFIGSMTDCGGFVWHVFEV